MHHDIDRKKCLASGWQRGAFINIKANQDILNVLPPELITHIDELGRAYLIPVLYDCALVEPRQEIEPWAQALICWPCTPDGNYKFGKNPRRFHFPINTPDGETYLEVKAISFCQVDRALLLTAEPLNDWQWPKLGLEILLNWVSERFRQPTFPDEWNNRMGKLKSRLNQLWKNDDFVNLCSGVYLNIQPFREVEPEELYTVNAYITVPPGLEGRQLIEFNKTRSPALVQKLKSILKSLSNVTVGEVDTINEDQFTKATERQYKRWQLEYYSYKDDPVAPLPAELEMPRDVG